MPEDPNPGGAGGGVTIDANDPSVKALIDDAVKAATAGLAKNRDEVLSEKRKLQEQLTGLQSQFEGIDPQVVKNLMERMKTDEETKLLAEGKVDEVIARRTDALRKDYDTKLTASQSALQEKDQTIAQRDQKIRSLVLGSSIRDAAAKLGLLPTAIEDAVFRANTVFEMDEGFNPVARDEHGTLKMSKNGKDPLSPAEWLEQMREQAPHWFPPSTGAGAGGGGGRKPGAAHTISREEARNPQAYQAAKVAAEKAGVPLQIVD